MKKFTLFTVVLILSLWTLSFAQDENTVCWWEPELPNPGDDITIYYNDIPGTLPDNGTKTVLMHWGINERKHGDWRQPPEIIWPTDSKPWADKKAIQSPMEVNENNVWELIISTLDTFRTIHFVFTNGSTWDNNNNLNWDLFLGEGPPPPPEHKDTLNVQILVDMAQAIVNRGFTYGDTVEAQFGFYSSAAEPVPIVAPLQRQGFSSFYVGNATVVSTIDSMLFYQYVAYKDKKQNLEFYYNFDYKGEVQGQAQFRQIKVTGNSISVVDTLTSNSKSRRMPFFRNLSRLAQDVLVTITCDVRPAIYQLLAGSVLDDIQGEVDVTDPDSVLKWGVAINGPATGSWSNEVGADWGVHLMTLANKRMYDDGTHGDLVPNDSIFAIQFTYYKDSTTHTIAQEFKFGIKGGDNEGGYGNNHMENIDDSQSTYTLEAQFGSIDPIRYRAWDFDKRQINTAVEESPTIAPQIFALKQNYPNPFNPETKIQYQIGEPAKVKLAVYNLLGEQIITLVDDVQVKGSYIITWNGRNKTGQQVGSGVYFYKIETNNYTESRKMILLK